MKDDGYIKFDLKRHPAPPPAEHELSELQKWRTRLWKHGLIGVSPEGVGYGNLSLRTPEPEGFIISGTQTGALPELEAKHYCRVTGFDLEAGRVAACGPIDPSSEALTHAACYAADAMIGAVIHIHHENLWNHLLKSGPHTGPRAAYGSPELARELNDLLQSLPSGRPHIIALEGHHAGIFAAAQSLDEAGEGLMKLLEKDSPAARIEAFFNSGQIHLTFGPDGKARIATDPLCFLEEEQRIIASILLSIGLEMAGKAASVDLNDLAARSGELCACEGRPDLPAAGLIREAGLRLGAPLRFGNKGSELELVFPYDAMLLLKALKRSALDQAVKARLDQLRRSFIHSSFQVFTGPEYCKVTLFDKQDVAQRFLGNVNPGVVIALGDSAVDIPFLTLEPQTCEYLPYYVGDPEDVADFPRMHRSPEGRGHLASLAVLREAFSAHSSGRKRLSAVISDIDNCLAPLDEELSPECASLLAGLVTDGVRLCLITGGHIESGYPERIIKPVVDEMTRMEKRME